MLFLSYFITVRIERIVPFTSDTVYDIKYNDKVLSFKTKNENEEEKWEFYGNSKVWYWDKERKDRCGTVWESRLYDIWLKARIQRLNE
jgi:hypothetical protein